MCPRGRLYIRMREPARTLAAYLLRRGSSQLQVRKLARSLSAITLWATLTRVLQRLGPLVQCHSHVVPI